VLFQALTRLLVQKGIFTKEKLREMVRGVDIKRMRAIQERRKL
jgi:hypothetical protein